MPIWLQWVFGLSSLLALLLYVLEKGPIAWNYLTAKNKYAPERSKKDLVIGTLIASLCALLWAISYSSLSYIQKTTTTLNITTGILFFSAVFYYLFSVAEKFRKKEMHSNAISIWDGGKAQLLILANIGNFYLSILALSYISAAQANAINHFSPIILVVLLIAKGKLTPNLYTLLSVILVVLGVWAINVDNDFKILGREAIIGSAISLLAGICFAFWANFIDDFESKLPTGSHRFRSLAHVFFGSYAVLVTITYFSEGSWSINAENLYILVLNGFRVALVYWLFNLAIRYSGALLPTVIVVFQVPLTIYCDSIINQYSPTIQLWVGSLLIVVAALGIIGDELQRAKS